MMPQLNVPSFKCYSKYADNIHFFLSHFVKYIVSVLQHEPWNIYQTELWLCCFTHDRSIKVMGLILFMTSKTTILTTIKSQISKLTILNPRLTFVQHENTRIHITWWVRQTVQNASLGDTDTSTGSPHRPFPLCLSINHLALGYFRHLVSQTSHHQDDKNNFPAFSPPNHLKDFGADDDIYKYFSIRQYCL